MSQNRVEQHLCHVAALTEAQTSDAQLLAAFLAQRDEAATPLGRTGADRDP
jgi:hypothetical protein